MKTIQEQIEGLQEGIEEAEYALSHYSHEEERLIAGREYGDASDLLEETWRDIGNTKHELEILKKELEELNDKLNSTKSK